MQYVFTITERVFHELTIEADDPHQALTLAGESLEAGNFGVEVASDIDLDYNYDAMQGVVENA